MSNDLSLYRIFRKMGVSRTDLSLNTHMNKDLFFDSYDMNIFLYFLESRFNINILDKDIPHLQTIGNTLAFVEHKISVN